MAGSCAGSYFELCAPRVVDTSTAVELARLSPIARAYCRLADKQVLAEIGERLGGLEPAGRVECCAQRGGSRVTRRGWWRVGVKFVSVQRPTDVLCS